MKGKILYSGKNPPQKNMDKDKKLLEELGDVPLLHLYDWEGPSATFGHFIQTEKILSSKGVQAVGLQLGRRPTGGGLVLHTADYAFSFLLPSSHPSFSLNTLENYQLVNELVKEAMNPLLSKNMSLLDSNPLPSSPLCSFFCMAKATVYDVMVGSQKIGGAAQRRKKQGLLHQGTISLARMPEKFLEKILLPESGVLEAMRENTFALLPSLWTEKELGELRMVVKERLEKVFLERFA